MKKHISTIILVIMLGTGLSLLLYPFVSDFWNTENQAKVITTYADNVSTLDSAQYQKIMDNAIKYNEKITQNGNTWVLSEEEKRDYYSQLKISESENMAYIEIPSINCFLPIYHGTSEGVLQKAIGHIEGSSLPIGGKGTHCIVSGHRGLPSAKLFSEIDKFTIGDTFMLHTLEETLTYEVDQIRIVLPNEIDELQIDKEQDFCTLVTCTPYGVNSHRLLVRGHRVENQEITPNIHITADAIQMEPHFVAVVLAVPLLLIIFLFQLIISRKKGGEI